MDMRKTKRLIWLCGALGVLGIGLTVMLVFSIRSSRTYELRLPKMNELKSVVLTCKGANGKKLVDAYAEDVLFILTGSGRSTHTESIQDTPVNVEDWIQVDCRSQDGETSTLFVYARPEAYSGEFFIEQPYNGIYEISGNEYHSIEKYAG